MTIRTGDRRRSDRVHENPFATRFTSPGALAYRAADGEGAAAVARRLERSGWRGQIVGPHGSGKSTLLKGLADELDRTGKETVTVVIDREDAGAMYLRGRAETVFLLEGFERLAPRPRRRLLSRIARSARGFVLTSHDEDAELAATAPVVARTRPTISLARDLFRRLTTERPTQLTMNDLDRSFAARGGNLRDVWLDLYLLHEARERGRTAPVCVAYSS